jgi:hypothetical protein
LLTSRQPAITARRCPAFSTSRVVLVGVLRPDGRRLLRPVQTFGGPPRALKAEACHLVNARRIVEEHVAHVLVLQPDQIGDSRCSGETPAELEVLAQAHAVEVGDLPLPRIDVAAGGDDLPTVTECSYFPAECFHVLTELFGFSVERADVTLVAILARLFTVRARSIRPLGKFVHPRKTVFATFVLIMLSLFTFVIREDVDY